jgi:CRISPR system Cascade subunit CasA
MTYDLRRESWIPFRRASGEIEWGPPSFLFEGIDSNPVVALATSRPDFNGALLEFLIGLFTAALKPEDEEAWRELWRTPPSPVDIHAALGRLPDAFGLDGDGARLLQDADLSDFVDCEVNDIELLLIDAAGSQTARLNKDLFVKRGRVAKLGRPAAAMTLLALQTYAPSGGQGHRTSMRGGGPLTTLVEPRTREDGGSLAHEQPLWRKIWANVETAEQLRARGPDATTTGAALLYPWLAPTRTSNSKAQGRPTTPQDAHPLQAYFGMPRRIRLDFVDEVGVCSLTGERDTAFASTFRARNYGIEYDSWMHPLSPYYRDKNGGWLPIHGQPAGIGWRDWAGLLFGAPDDGKRPAQCVANFAENRARKIRVGRPRLHAFGYDMDNMKARGWVEAELPAYALADHEQEKTLARIAARLTEAASLAASALLIGVKSAWFQRSEDAKGDLSYVKARFWSETEGGFFAAIERALTIGAPIDIETTIKREFREPLEQTALSIFDALCPMDGLEFADVRRLVSARHGLRSDLRGYRKLGSKLFEALALPQPEGTKAARKRKEAAA